MSSGGSSSGPSAAKLGGVTLIGVGLLAGVFGVGTAFSGAPSTDSASPPKQVSPSAPATDSAPPEQSSSDSRPQDPPESRSSEPKPPESRPKPPESNTDEPGQQTGDQQTGDQNPPADQEQRITVRVYNNSKIPHLAEQAAKDFRGFGYAVPEVGNYSAGRIYTTTVYFRPGTAEQAQAKQVAQRIGARLEPRFPGLEQASPGVIAIITNDYSGLNGG